MLTQVHSKLLLNHQLESLLESAKRLTVNQEFLYLLEIDQPSICVLIIGAIVSCLSSVLFIIQRLLTGL